MSEYLFRGKRIDSEKWIEGNDFFYDKDIQTTCIGGYDYYSSGEGLQREPFCYCVIPESVGLWSGLTTIGENPTKVFSGDIIQYEDYIGVVKFGRFKQVPGGTEHIGFYVDVITDRDIRNDLVWWIERFKAQVIGNVTDNPELLEVNK